MGSDGNLVGVANPGLGTLGNYGGPTETIALLPGSPAIDAGTSSAGATAPTSAARPRVGAVDIGAFESQGFTMTPVAGSTPQTAAIGWAVRQPAGGDRDGQQPGRAGGRGGRQLRRQSRGQWRLGDRGWPPSAVIAGGQAGVTGGPNNVDGSYTVTASVPGLPPVSFDLTNTGPVFTKLVVNTTSGALFPEPAS